MENLPRCFCLTFFLARSTQEYLKGFCLFLIIGDKTQLDFVYFFIADKAQLDKSFGSESVEECAFPSIDCNSVQSHASRTPYASYSLSPAPKQWLRVHKTVIRKATSLLIWSQFSSLENWKNLRSRDECIITF